MRKVLITLLAVLCFSAFAFASFNNADQDEDYAVKMANRSLLAPTPVVKVASAAPYAAGDYYIPQGANPMGFATLKAAVDSINANGVTGTVNLLLDADTLREDSFTFNADLSVTNNVVVKPASGRDVVLIVAGGTSQGNGDQLIGFDKGYVTIDGSNNGTTSRNLIITTEQTSIEVPIGLNTANADTVVIKNLIIKNLDNGTSKFKYGAVTNDVAGIMGFTVDNCQIGSPEFPVYRDGVAVWGTSSAPTQGIVTNNDIYAGARGIATYVVNDCIFNNNNITMLPATSGTAYAYNHGIYVTGASGPTEVKNNVITCVEASTVTNTYVMGIAFAGNAEGGSEYIYVENNMVNVGAADETHNVYGIGFRSSNDMGNIKLYHNTVVVNDVACTSTCYGIGHHTNGTGPVDIEMMNNIVINNHTGNTGSAALGLIPTSTVLSSDYNDLVSDQNFVNFKGTSYADLSAWQAAGQDSNSVSKDVTFEATDDLHLAYASDVDYDLIMNLIPTVLTDIDGDPRNVEDSIAYAGADEGSEYSNDLAYDYGLKSDVSKWRSDNSGWTSRSVVDSTLMLSDAGWTIDGRRNVYATPGTFFKATASIKTGSFDTSPSQYLNFGVEGLASEIMQVDCISEDDFTTFTVIGYAENSLGTLFINGQGASGKDTVWIDEYTFEDDYVPGLTTLSTVADARAIADGDPVATKGIVTVSTQFGYAGPVYIQDGSAGIAVYGSSVSQNVADGDEIIVVGEIDIYNGLVEVSGTPDVIVLSSGNVVEPVEVTWDDIKDAESYEGQLVVLKGCDTLDTGLSWAETEGSNKGFDLKDKNDSTFYCYIDKDTDIDGSPKPTKWPINITGIVGDYRGAQLLPRSLVDFNPNVAPGPFTLLNPVDNDSISTFDDPALVDLEMAPGDTVKALLINWTEAVDPDALDTVTYKMVFVGDGPDDVMTTVDTFMLVPINEDEPYDMNGTYTYYFEATDLSGESSVSDTHTITFDFPAPPELMYADITLLDGVPTWYAQFNLPLDAPEVADFTVLDVETPGVVTPTAVTVVAPNAVMVAAPMNEDGHYALVASGLTTTGSDISVTDTSEILKAYIPFSDAHPEDVEKQIESFNTGTGLFWAPTGSGSTRGVLTSSTFESQDSVVYNGAGAAALTLLDDPAVDGGWYVRLYHTVTHVVKTSSELLLMVKGTGDVDMRISLKDKDGTGGYEQGPWKHVSLCENDWQVVSFDLVNDEAEGWITGDGTVEGETAKIEAIHMRSTTDEDVVLYLDGFTERQVLEPVNITLNVIMKKQVADEAFNLATDFVDVAGTFNEWGTTSAILDDFDGDTTYSVVLPLMPYSRHEFKFRVNGNWDTSEFPSGGANRVLSVRDYDRSYTYWYDNDTLVVEDAIDGIPAEFALHQNYPNPFNPTTSINFDLPEVSDVKLVIYDITGRKVRTLVSASGVAAGYKKIVWNGRDEFGNNVSTGMYIYRLQAGDYVDVKKMTFLK